MGIIISSLCGNKLKQNEILLYQKPRTEVSNDKDDSLNKYVKRLQIAWKSVRLYTAYKKNLNNFRNIINLINFNIEKYGLFVDIQEFLNRMPIKVFKTFRKFTSKEFLDMNFSPINDYRIKRKPLLLYENNYIYQGQWTPLGEKDGFGILEKKHLLLWNENI